jgi:large subunit ribosomal protein L15
MPLYRRVPKLKHFPLVNQKEYTIVNVKGLADLTAGTEVSLESLLEVGILTTNDGPLKVLGDGEIGVALTVKAAAFTQSAKEKIEQAGGTWELVS